MANVASKAPSRLRSASRTHLRAGAWPVPSGLQVLPGAILNATVLLDNAALLTGAATVRHAQSLGNGDLRQW
jgi:hypothetical protein